MNNIQLTGMALAMSAASIFALTPAADAGSIPKCKCPGIHASQGTNAPTQAQNKCKSLNTCVIIKEPKGQLSAVGV